MVILTVQAPEPVHAPLQPSKREPIAGVAVSVTDVPLLMAALQLVVQLSPAGVDVTLPLPLPLLVSDNV
ncbi:MAG: hypothetical protein OEM00_09825 [Burkholderiaceae bacterium]|nr:hypothetical protein [Burkholderiaceae bacterium]